MLSVCAECKSAEVEYPRSMLGVLAPMDGQSPFRETFVC